MHFKDGAMAGVKHTANYTTEVEQHEKRTQRRSRRMLGDAQWLQQAWPDTQCLPLQKPGQSKGNCEAGESPPPTQTPRRTRRRYRLLCGRARTVFCAPSCASDTAPKPNTGGGYGTLLIGANATWRGAAKACLNRCAACTACMHISVRLDPPTCNWYSDCTEPEKDTSARARRAVRGRVPSVGFRSGPAFPKGARDRGGLRDS